LYLIAVSHNNGINVLDYRTTNAVVAREVITSNMVEHMALWDNYENLLYLGSGFKPRLDSSERSVQTSRLFFHPLFDLLTMMYAV